MNFFVSRVGNNCMRMNLGASLYGIVFSLVLALPAVGHTLKIDTIAVAPFGFTGADGKPTGMMYEIGNRIAEEAGFKHTNDIIPYARTIIDLESGAADFVLRFTNEQLPQIAVQVATVVTMPTIVVGLAGSRYKSLNDLHGKSVGQLRGGKFDDKFDADSAITKYEANDYIQIMRMLAAKRLDAGIGSSVGVYYSANSVGIKPEELGAPLVLSSKDFILHFSKKNADPKTTQALKAAVEKLNKQGEIKKIINKYMGDYKWSFAGATK